MNNDATQVTSSKPRKLVFLEAFYQTRYMSVSWNFKKYIFIYWSSPVQTNNFPVPLYTPKENNFSSYKEEITLLFSPNHQTNKNQSFFFKMISIENIFLYQKVLNEINAPLI